LRRKRHARRIDPAPGLRFRYPKAQGSSDPNGRQGGTEVANSAAREDVGGSAEPLASRAGYPRVTYCPAAPHGLTIAPRPAKPLCNLARYLTVRGIPPR